MSLFVNQIPQQLQAGIERHRLAHNGVVLCTQPRKTPMCESFKLEQRSAEVVSTWRRAADNKKDGAELPVVRLLGVSSCVHDALTDGVGNSDALVRTPARAEK